MRRLQPPAHLLLAFATTARFGSISRAAEALHLTQSAVSKQVQELERWTGVPLFERVRKRLSLTPAGQRYEAAVRPLLAQLEAATLDLITSGDGGGALHLSTLPTFGAKWLIPRLPDFQRAHPQIALHFVPYVQGYDFQRADLDCSILFGDGHWPGASRRIPHRPRSDADRAARAARQAAAAQAAGHRAVHAAAARLGAARLVALVPGPRRAPGVNAFAGPQLDQFHSLIRAVAAGMGLALVPRCLVRDDVAAGVVSPRWTTATSTNWATGCATPSRAPTIRPSRSFGTGCCTKRRPAHNRPQKRGLRR